MGATLNMKRLSDLRRKVHAGEIEEQAVKGTGEKIEAHVQANWSVSSPSSPGNPPAVVTGELKSSVRLVKINNKHYRLEARADHAIPLEFGTSRMAPRPFLAPAVEANREEAKRQGIEATLRVVNSV